MLGCVYSMWQQGSQNLNDCLAVQCIEINAESTDTVRQTGLEASIAGIILSYTSPTRMYRRALREKETHQKSVGYWRCQ